MSLDYVRKIVSGKKARFVDKAASVNLDLVYVTDRIIIMGYPSVGVSALYRNRRRDVLKFINDRHGDKWWIWNLCPLYENAYSPESMDKRVSRYPFPDHHPPPLPLLPLAVREMTAWLEGDPERIAIIHCKAGKGRSGTLLCSYLLSLPTLPPPPQLDRSYTEKDLKVRIRQREKDHEPADSQEAIEEGYQHVDVPESQESETDGWVVVGGGQEVAEIMVKGSGSSSGHRPGTPARSEILRVDTPQNRSVALSTSSSTTTLSRPSPSPSIRIQVSTDPPYEPIDVGDERPPGRKGQEDREDGKVDRVFKLHSSRRMKPTSTGRGVSIPSQRRWCRYVHLLFSHHVPKTYQAAPPARIRLVSVTLLLHPPTSWQRPLASLILGSNGSGNGKAWASVARYDDDYVEELERRGGDGEGVSGKVSWGGVGGDGSYDSKKMFRTCGKIISGEMTDVERKTMPKLEENLNEHHLVPESSAGSTSLILDRGREMRLKLHLGSLPLGWLWLIPAFHLAEEPEFQNPPSVSTETATQNDPSAAAANDPSGASRSPRRIHTLTIPRSQVDFPVGPGQALHSVLIRFEDLPTHGGSPARLMSEEEEKESGMRDTTGEGMVNENEE